MFLSLLYSVFTLGSQSLFFRVATRSVTQYPNSLCSACLSPPYGHKWAFVRVWGIWGPDWGLDRTKPHSWCNWGRQASIALFNTFPIDAQGNPQIRGGLPSSSHYWHLLPIPAVPPNVMLNMCVEIWWWVECQKNKSWAAFTPGHLEPSWCIGASWGYMLRIWKHLKKRCLVMKNSGIKSTEDGSTGTVQGNFS